MGIYVTEQIIAFTDTYKNMLGALRCGGTQDKVLII